MYYETAQTIGPGWQKSYKPTRCENMTWSPSLKHFRSPGSSPQSYRRIIHQDGRDNDHDDAAFFNENSSPTFPRKVFRDVWTDTPASSHKFGDRPRLFKRVFTPNRWEDDDDFDRTRNTVRQMARDFGSDFDRDVARDFDGGFRHRDRGHRSDIEDEIDRAAGKVHHIPIMVEKRLEEMRSRFGKNSRENDSSEYPDESEEWQGPEVQRLMKNFERDDDFPHMHNRQRVPKGDRSYTCPMNSKWDPSSVHTLPTRRSSKGCKIFDETPTAVPKSVFRSYSETHDDIPKYQQQQHAAAFRSHSDGHCPKTIHVTKISINVPSHPENSSSTAYDENKNDMRNQETDKESQQDNRNSKSRTRYKDKHSDKEPTNSEEDANQNDNLKPEDDSKNAEENPIKRTSLQQIAAVLKNVADLFVHAESYSGTGRDKQYRFLDEMLTRCMLRLDDVDTEGREDIRSARKAAVMQVQLCIEKLESKADESEARRKSEKENSNEKKESGNEQPPEKGSSNEIPDHEDQTESFQESTLETNSAQDTENTKL